jgi:hypothetical protein
MRGYPYRLQAALAGAVLLLLPQAAFAGDGAKAFAAFVEQHVINQAIDAFTGVAALMLFFYGFNLIINAAKENAYTDAINSFVHAVIGFAILAISGAFVKAFMGPAGGGGLINPAALIPGINSITGFLISGAAGMFVLMLTITGIRMLTTQGDSGEMTKLRGILLQNAVGLAITLLSLPIVGAVAGASAGILIDEMIGLARFLLIIIGTLCVCAIVVAGAYLIISVDESYKDRAKKTIVGTLITLGVVLGCYSVILTFV